MGKQHIRRWRRGLGTFFATAIFLVGCQSELRSLETVGTSTQALSSTAARVMGFETPSDWTTTAGQLGPASRYIEGSAALSLVNPGSFTTITSRALSSIGSGVSGVIGFDVQIPDIQPGPAVTGSVQLSLSIPSKGLNNVVVGLKDLANMPRGIFRRVEFPLSQSLQQALNSTYSDLRLTIALNAPSGATPYFFDRLSFGHSGSETVNNARNAAIVGFETQTSWIPSGATTELVARRTEKLHALSVMPSGYTALTSDRLATPSEATSTVGFDLHLPAIQPNPNDYGEVKLFVDLPSQGVYSTYVGRQNLLQFSADTYARISFVLPDNVSSKLTQEFDDLRFRIELNTPPGAGPYLLDRFRFGTTTAPTESVSVSMPMPANISPNKLLLLATTELSIGAGVKLLPISGTRMVAASFGGVSVGASSELDSLLASGRVDLAANAKVRGFIAGTSDIHPDALTQIFGEAGGSAGASTVATWTTSFEPSALDIAVSSGGRVELPPGRYRNVIVSNGTVDLSPGTYRIDTLRVSAAGAVELDTNHGSTAAFVRSELAIDGRLIDSALPGADLLEAGRRVNSSVWLYSGTKDVRVPLNLPGLLVAPGANVIPYWNSLLDAQAPPSLAGIWGGRVSIPPPPQNLRGDVRVLKPPYNDLLEKGAPFLFQRSPTDVRVSAQSDPTDGNLPLLPVLVEADNPELFGTFEWHSPNEAAVNGDWVGIAQAHLASRHEPLDDVGWAARLLPGTSNQSPVTTSAASFRTRAFNLFHGKTFKITRSFFYAPEAVPVGFGSDAKSLFVQLDPQIFLVPVLLVVWDSPTEISKALAQIDFTATQRFSAVGVSTGQEPTPETAGPNAANAVLGGGAAIPPDDIWNQCGIQIQAIGALYLGPQAPPSQRQCSGFNATQDYALNYQDLEQRIRAVVPADQFEQVFGSHIDTFGGLHPLIVQYGRFPGSDLCNYAGKTDAGGTGYIQINDDTGATTAHEIGHALFGSADHDADPDNLMHAGATGRTLTKAQCDIARNAAASYSARLREFYVSIGFADPVSEPAPVVSPVPRVPGGGFSPLYTQVCCDRGDGKKGRMLATLCLFTGGRPASDCSVCCKSKRTCPADSCCAHASTSYAVVDTNDCEPEDVAPTDSCTCCDFGANDSCKKPLLPTQTCTNEGGTACTTDPR